MRPVERDKAGIIRAALTAAAVVAALLAGCKTSLPLCPTGTAAPERLARYDPAPMPTLSDAELRAAIPAWHASCAAWQHRGGSAALAAAWAPVCERLPAADADAGIRALLADCCTAWRIVAVAKAAAACRPAEDDGQPRTTGLMTGYYEPELAGSRSRTPTFHVPLYGVPMDLVTVDLAAIVPELSGRRLRGRIVSNGTGLRLVPYWSRAEIDRGDGPPAPPLLWVDDPLAAFLLQVQGSGRILLDDGSVVRVGYADTNGHPYRSIGGWLVDQHELALADATIAGIAAWAKAHPERLDQLLESNPSYVFFRELPLGDPSRGPIGALGVALTADHAVAADPRFVPLGTPIVFQAEEGANAAPRLAFAQDTGGAIRGPLRFDLFRGTGADAGAAAGEQRGRVAAWLLLPKGLSPAQALSAPAAN